MAACRASGVWPCVCACVRVRVCVCACAFASAHVHQPSQPSGWRSQLGVYSNFPSKTAEQLGVEPSDSWQARPALARCLHQAWSCLAGFEPRLGPFLPTSAPGLGSPPQLFGTSTCLPAVSILFFPLFLFPLASRSSEKRADRSGGPSRRHGRERGAAGARLHREGETAWSTLRVLRRPQATEPSPTAPLRAFVSRSRTCCRCADLVRLVPHDGGQPRGPPLRVGRQQVAPPLLVPGGAHQHGRRTVGTSGVLKGILLRHEPVVGRNAPCREGQRFPT
jgi:hypothetical protein